MNDQFHGLTPRAVCRHRYPGGPHTIPTMIDRFLYTPFWTIAIIIYRLTGFRPCQQARAAAIPGLIYYPWIGYRQYALNPDPFSALLVIFCAALPLVVIGATLRMDEIHERLNEQPDSRPTIDDIVFMFGLRQWRLAFVVVWLIPPWPIRGVLADMVFTVWPLYAIMLGGPRTPNLFDKAADGARRLRELLASLDRRPAFRPA